MTASKEVVETEKKLKELGHEIVLPEFTHEYAAMDTIDKMHTESARNKVEYDLIRGYFEKIKNSDAVLIANVEKKESRDISAEILFSKWASLLYSKNQFIFYTKFQMLFIETK